MPPRRMPFDPAAPVSRLAGVGPVRERQLREAGVVTLADLLGHLPLRYEDRRELVPLETLLGRLEEGKGPLAATVRGRLSQLRRVRLRRRRVLVRAALSDASATVQVVWFNRPYLLEQVEEGREYLLHGRLRSDERGTRLVNPSCEPATTAVDAARVVPVYPSLGPFGPAAVRRLLGRLLATYDVAAGVDDPLLPELRRRHALPPLGESLVALHDPPVDADVEALNGRRTPARQRLVYGELFELQRDLVLLRETARQEVKPHRYRIDATSRAALRSLLPFRLTAAQRRVLAEIVDDLRSDAAMQRLLQGDVGCGKTIVAALAMALAAESGLQAAFMAPTELLAEQHYATLDRLLGAHYRLALVTASSSDATATRSAIETGEVQIAVGTHALIQEAVSFQRLGLAVVDEQHRFGVGQRRRLATKGERPDVLVMTATPIPRSLALTVYGDLDLSVIDELPPGRTPVCTEVVDAEQRERVYGDVRTELEAGGQAYVVFPLVGESRSLEAAALDTAGSEVAARLAPFSCATLHGRTPADERERVMSRFAAGEISVLLATTVIEVGVDVPRATLMVIESAERFGLSQLHQLRGRVGRGGRASRCIALHGALGEEAARRLEVFAGEEDGFSIAEADLEIRGPGDLMGTRQSGLPALRAASLPGDGRWLERARHDAQEWVRAQPTRELARLRRQAASALGVEGSAAAGC